MQDLGAAGLTCALAELSARGGCRRRGADLDLVPVRESGMTGYELLLSESQERMLLVVRAGHEDEVRAVVRAVRAARGADRAGDRGARHPRPLPRASWCARFPAAPWPTTRRATCRRPRRLADLEERRAERLDDLAAADARCRRHCWICWPAPTCAAAEPVWRRYDHMNGTNTLVGPGAGDAAVLRIKGTPRALALSIDGPGRLERWIRAWPGPPRSWRAR